MSVLAHGRFAQADYDALVIGGGPAGCATATLIADAGYRVLLVERDEAPRFKIGESLMPACWDPLARLGMIEKMQASHFPKKYSVQFFSRDGKPSSPFYFSDVSCADHPQIWQVLRSEFDQMLLDNASEHGVEVHRGISAREILFEQAEDGSQRAVGARLRTADGEPIEVPARVVVDASGQSALIARELKLHEGDPRLRNASIFTHYEGTQRDAGLDEGATLVLNTQHQDTWFWYIPLPGDMASVGVVGPLDHLVRPPKRPPQEVFEEELLQCPGLTPRLAGARQTRPVQMLRDFTYRSTQRAGDGWVMVGDAHGFVDPLYSSGVFLALKSGEMAADAIVEGLAADDLSGERLGAFEPEFLRGMEAIRKLVYAFYDQDFSFARFLDRHPEHREDLVQILIGNVFREGVDDLFVPMAEMAKLPTAWT